MAWFFLFFLVFWVGGAFGSFLAVVMVRLHEKRSPCIGRSSCGTCRKAILWRDNIPIFSFFLLRGKCRFCQAPIPEIHPIVEILVAFAFVGIMVSLLFPVAYRWDIVWYEFCLLLLLLFIALYDAWYGEIFYWSTFVPAGLLFGISLWRGWFPWESLILGILVGGGWFLAQYLFSHGQWVGGGDIGLGILMGVVLGWPGILFALLLSYIVGGLCALCLVILKRKTLQGTLPFAPFLVLGTIVVFFFQSSFTQWFIFSFISKP
ncbi:MAG: hypothetical protein A3G08_02510 [Candidatus Magasanikbacteria bacterium RIFCSPLOWO2_12_FULL_47_9b]|nr:MAG: hypothetical protein A3G08_02510 [Candidatus Magasanikbacteria bacterium RIFCSPLOWO2_12_FULL_47_9b]